MMPQLKSKTFIARWPPASRWSRRRSEEHTSELQSRQYLVCRLLLEKKNKTVHRVRHRMAAAPRDDRSYRTPDATAHARHLTSRTRRTTRRIESTRSPPISWTRRPPASNPQTPSTSSFSFLNGTATTEIYTLSLHDALPIYDATVEIENVHRQMATGKPLEQA